MKHLLRAALALIVIAPTASAAEPPAGNWKFRITEGNTVVTFLLAFTKTEEKWVGDFIGASVPLRAEPKMGPLTVTGDRVKFALNFAGREAFGFDGVLAKDGAKLSGSLSKFGGPLELTTLYPSQLRKLTDAFELAREDFSQIEGGQPLFDAGYAVLSQAGEKKLTADDARGVAEKLTKAAAGYGARWERTTALKLADTLAGQEGLAEVAVVQARRAERMLTDDTPIAVQMTVLETVARVLTKAGKAADAKKYDADLAKLEAQDLAAFAKETVAFETPAYAGRKAKSDRVAVVEVFTGAECPPCVAVDAAFDGLMKTFPPADVLFLQYHIHVPGPDPLTNEDSMGRAAGVFADQISAPRVLINGQETIRGGGDLAAAKGKYAEIRAAIEKELEAAAPVKLALTVTKGEKGLTVKAAVSDLEKPGEKVKLRFAVVEPLVRYVGGNGARFHQNVVRAMPGGPSGFPLTKKAQEQSVTVDPDTLRGELAKYLDTFAKDFAPFPNPDRPLRLKNLKVVAFVQDDATGNILTAAQVDLDAK